MKAEQLYQSLKELAEKLEINVTERQLQKKDFKAKSGFCTVKDKNFFIMDRRMSAADKNDLLGSCLCRFPTDEIYVLPAVREFLNTCRGA